MSILDNWVGISNNNDKNVHDYSNRKKDKGVKENTSRNELELSDIIKGVWDLITHTQSKEIEDCNIRVPEPVRHPKYWHTK